MKNIFITGATGLVGSHLVIELLSDGYHRPIVAVRNTRSVSKLEYMLHRSGYSLSDVEMLDIDLGSIHDLREKLSERKLDTIFHCAARVKIGGAAGEDLVNENVEITHNLCTLALEYPMATPLLVHVSSIATLGEGVSREATPYEPSPEIVRSDLHNASCAEDELIIDEQSVPQAIWSSSAYTRSKFYSEGEVWRAAARGLRVVVVNPAVIIGHTAPQANFWFPKLQNVISRGMPLWLEGSTGWVGAKDVARAMICLSRNGLCNDKRYLLCAENLSYREFLQLMASSSRAVGPRIKVPGCIIKALSYLWPELKTVARQRAIYDGSAICQDIPEFKYTPIPEILRQIQKPHSA